jgi:hypothetical protein
MHKKRANPHKTVRIATYIWGCDLGLWGYVLGLGLSLGVVAHGLGVKLKMLGVMAWGWGRGWGDGFGLELAGLWPPGFRHSPFVFGRPLILWHGVVQIERELDQWIR